MKTKNALKAKIILGIYLLATCALLVLGYSVQKPKVKQQEFPFTLTYTLLGETTTLSEVYVVEYSPKAKYIGDDSIAWFGYIKDHNRLELDYISLADVDDKSYAINLHIDSGYLMGDPAHAGAVCEPEAVCHIVKDMESEVVTEAAELEELGFVLESWEYPVPIENSFSYGGVSMSSEATMYTTAIAVVALLACMICIKKDADYTSTGLDKASVVLNFLVTIVALPFILAVSALSEIVADASLMQQLVYFAPALTALGVAASVTFRRMGSKKLSFWIQFAGPAVFGLTVLLGMI